jgi:hypothetical protein
MEYPTCTCEEKPYPYACACLGIQVRSPEMRAICRGEPILIDGERQEYHREKMIGLWVGLSQMAKPTAGGFFKGAVKATRAYFNNDPKNLPVIQERFDICSACDFQFLGRCKSCGCPVGQKVWEKAGKCPEGYW